MSIGRVDRVGFGLYVADASCRVMNMSHWLRDKGKGFGCTGNGDNEGSVGGKDCRLSGGFVFCVLDPNATVLGRRVRVIDR